MKEIENEKVRFKDLSMPLKVLVVACWVVISWNIIGFLAGFIIGLTAV